MTADRKRSGHPDPADTLPLPGLADQTIEERVKSVPANKNLPGSVFPEGYASGGKRPQRNVSIETSTPIRRDERTTQKKSTGQ